MRVLPAPFAIVSASAELLESDGALSLPGSATVGALADGATVTATNATLQGPTTLRGDVRGVQNVFIRDLDVRGGHLSMLRAEGFADNLSTRWEEFSADRTLEVGTSFFKEDAADSLSVLAADDGFAMVMIRAEDTSGYRSFASATLSNGDFTILAGARLQEGEGSSTRLFTFPVRKQRPVTLALQVHHGVLRNPVRAWAKVKMVYVGAN